MRQVAKQAIFALHHGRSNARELVASAGALGRALLDGSDGAGVHVAKFSVLRHAGALKGALEEVAEADLSAAWLERPADGVILAREDLVGGMLLPDEYLGALGDLIGEIGRYAVTRAAARDAEGVRGALASAVAVQTAYVSLGGALPRKIDKKIGALRTAVRKLEQLLWELSLVERSGRRSAKTSVNVGDDGGGSGAAEARDDDREA